MVDYLIKTMKKKQYLLKSKGSDSFELREILGLKYETN